MVILFYIRISSLKYEYHFHEMSFLSLNLGLKKLISDRETRRNKGAVRPLIQSLRDHINRLTEKNIKL